MQQIELKFAPWIDDADPPDYMDDAAIKRMVDGFEKLLGTPELKDFNPYHEPGGSPEGGRFASGPGGGEGDVSRETLTGFISPNVGNMSFSEAVQALGSPAHKALARASDEIDGAFGVASPSNKPVIGAWADGAENSVMFAMPHTSLATGRVAAAMKGYLANQKQVLVFEAHDDGPNFMAEFDAHGTLDAIHEQLTKSGLAFHTLDPIEGGARVIAYGKDQGDVHAIEEAAKHYDAEVTAHRGTGEFIGTVKEDGTDAEQRADARAVYDGIISGGVEGQDVGKIWHDIRDRWDQEQIATLHLSNNMLVRGFQEASTEEFNRPVNPKFEWHRSGATWKQLGTPAELDAQAKTAVLQLGGNEREYAALVAKSGKDDSGTRVAVVRGEKYSAAVPDEIMKSFDGSFDLHHNHPLPYLLSNGDLNFLNRAPRLTEIYEHDMDGGSSSARIPGRDANNGERWYDFGMMSDHYNNRLERMLMTNTGPIREMMEGLASASAVALDDDEIKQAAYDMKHGPTFISQHASAVGLANAGVIEYKYKFSPWMQRMADTYAKPMARANEMATLLAKDESWSKA